MRVRRQPEATDLSEAWHNNRSHSGHAPEPINPYAQPDLTSDGWTDLDTTELHLPGWRPLARCSVADPPPFSPESFKGYPIDPQEMHTGAHTYQRRPITMPELSSRRQYSTEAASPPSSRGRECHGVSKQWQMSYQAKQVDYKAVLHLPPQGPDVHQDYGADRRYQQHWDGELQMYSRHATWYAPSTSLFTLLGLMLKRSGRRNPLKIMHKAICLIRAQQRASVRPFGLLSGQWQNLTIGAKGLRGPGSRLTSKGKERL